ncbi:PaaI family thioesterase [Sphingosinithalassobacter tenebrarum]|uniref:PaaI family thioesterase n=1 Tax=Stakelama tenebrarum TaxID=2711215 RepID=A0A6G6YA11_9SPHN|nr:PaaI family thioesterase [Sphingosinithalassobacter tenebrarum]QIG81765.1 PaaI family thioesterase [Sphingosinithalassobacter tenebrarum]
MEIPYAELLGLEVEQGEGAPVLVMPFDDGKIGRPGFIHGGAIGGLLEMAAVAALMAALDDESARWKPINVTVDYMRGGRDQVTRAQGAVTRLGTRIANVESRAWQESPDKPIAAARMNFLIRR